MRIAGQHHLHRDIDAWHDRTPIRIHEIQPQLVSSFIFMTEGHAQRDGALRMDRWQLLGIDGIECPQQIQLAVVISGGIAKYCNLNVHALFLLESSAATISPDFGIIHI